MAKYTYKEIKEIKEIIACTPKELSDIGTDKIENIQWLGGYSSPSWNWGYKVGAFVYKNRVQIAVFLFGHIVA